MDPTLEAPPLLPEVGFPHMLSADCMQQMILVQVNPGDTFTIPTEGGHIQYITGPAPVPMISHNGSVTPIYLPPGYMPPVIEENGMRKMMLLPPAMEFHPSLPPPPPHLPHYPPPHPATLLPHPHIFPPEMPPHYVHHMHSVPVYPEQELLCPSMGVHSLKAQDQLHRRIKDHSTVTTATVANANGHLTTNGVHHSTPPPVPKGAPLSLHNGHNKPPTPSPRPSQHRRHPGWTRATPPSDMESTDIEAELNKAKEMLSNMAKPSVNGLTCRSAILSWCPPITLPPRDPLVPDKHIHGRTNTHTPPLLCYELALSQSGTEGDYKPVYQGKDTTFTLGDLQPATHYYARVCVACRSIKGSPSQPAMFTTLCAPPDAPPPPRILVRTKSSIGLQWKVPNDNGSKITAYLLECCEIHVPGKHSSFKEVYCGPAKQHKVVRLTPATRYGFRVAAKSNTGMSAFSEVLSCCTVGSPPPTPPPPVLNSVGVSWISLLWGAPCGPGGKDGLTYTLQMEESQGFQVKYTGEEICYTVKSLDRSTSYRFRVSAANSEGSSQPSAIVEYSTKADVPARLGAPQLHSPPLPHRIHTTWNAPEHDGGSPVLCYVLELSQTDNLWEEVYSGSQVEHVCDGLKPGTWYKLRVYCQNQEGQSQVSESLCVKTALTHPGPCRALCVTGASAPSEIMLNWDAPECLGGSDVSVYAVKMAEATDSQHTQVFEGPERRCTITSLKPTTQYSFWARAANQAGWGPWSEMLEASTTAGPPLACAPPLATVRGPTCVSVSWQMPPCNGAQVNKFQLEWSMQGEPLQVEYSGPEVFWEMTGLTPATEYCCRVQAVSEAGAGPFGDITMVTTPPSVPAAVECVEEVPPESVSDVTPGTTVSRLALRWEEPRCHGAEITGYDVDVGEQHPLSVGRVNQHILENLQPNTTYRVKVRALNSIGAGPYGPSLRLRTSPLPPEPPSLECTLFSPHSLKLRWGLGPSRTPTPRGTHYCLHMQTADDRSVCVYSGSSHSFKLQRLNEGTEYHFSIQAVSSAGRGAHSPRHTFSTTHSPPPQLKAPKIEAVHGSLFTITWETLQPMKGDPILYTLQLIRGKELDQLYRGAATSFTWQSVPPTNTDWRVRVCAGRHRTEGGELWGHYSPATALPVLPDVSRDARSVGTAPTGCSNMLSTSSVQWHRKWHLSDEHFALLVLLVFGMVAILFAVLIQYVFLSKD